MGKRYLKKIIEYKGFIVKGRRFKMTGETNVDIKTIKNIANIEYKRNALVNLLEGYRKANQIIRTEKKRRLARSTKEDSFQEYDALCRMWDSVKRESSEKLEEQKTLFLIKRRQLFNKAGKVRKK
jgi:hypothetical protein